MFDNLIYGLVLSDEINGSFGSDTTDRITVVTPKKYTQVNKLANRNNEPDFVQYFFTFNFILPKEI